MAFNKHYDYLFLSGRVSHYDFDSITRPFVNGPDWLRANRKAGEPVRCLCKQTQGVYPLLDVCQVGATAYLRRRKDTHLLHARDCQHAVPPDSTESGQAKDYVPGIRRSAEGEFSIGLSADLFPARAEQKLAAIEKVAHADDDQVKTPHAPSTRRGTSTLLGLLQFLFDEAETGVWRPELAGRRTAIRLSQGLNVVARKCRDTRGNPLSSFVLTFDRVQTDAQLAQFVANSTGGTASTRELILIAPLTRVTPPRWDGAHVLLHLGGRVSPVWITPERWDECAAAFRRQLVATQAGSFVHQVWTAITIRLPTREQRQGVFFASAVAVVALSRDFIPVESTYEAAFADYLVAQKRAFTKPIRFDHGDQFPDFILNDASRQTHVEVLGFNDDEYRRRIETKRALCAADGLGFVVWDAINGEPLPSLPPAVRGVQGYAQRTGLQP